MNTTTKRSKMSIQVMGLNAINEYIKEIVAYDLPSLQKYVGIKIYKADGSHTAKFDFQRWKKDDIKGDNFYMTASHRYGTSGDKLIANINICISYDGHGYYFENWVTLGEMEGQQILKSLYTKDEILSDKKDIQKTYTEHQLQDLVKDFEQKKQALRDLYNSIPRKVREVFYLSI